MEKIKNPSRCVDCGKICKTSKAKRCRICSNKGKNNPKYNGGKARCIKCNKELNHHKKDATCRECLKLIRIKKCTCECGKIKSKFSLVCSACDSKRKSIRYKGINNPSYIDGKSKNPYNNFEFNLKLKDEIRHRDKCICVICMRSEASEINKLGRNLSVHHIDYDKNNNSKDNLVTLCIYCHLKTNYNRNYWKQYFRRNISWKKSLQK
jgi:hypothetical protein